MMTLKDVQNKYHYLEHKGLSFTQISSEMLKEISKFNNVNSILMSVLQNSALLYEISKRSYKHSNGFYKIVLGELDVCGAKLRLHIWKSSAYTIKFEDNDIHNHRWDFASLILAGEFLHEVYDFDSDGKICLYHYHYFSPEKSNVFSLDFVGKNNIKKTREFIQKPGECYYLSSNILHKVRVSGENISATLFLQSPVIKGNTDILTLDKRHKDHTKSQKVAIERLSATELSGLIEDLSFILSKVV